MSRCVEVSVRVLPEGEPAKEAPIGNPWLPTEEGATQIHRFVIDMTAKEFFTNLSKFIRASSDKSVSSCKENLQAGGFPIPEAEQKDWCKYI